MINTSFRNFISFRLCHRSSKYKWKQYLASGQR